MASLAGGGSTALSGAAEPRARTRRLRPRSARSDALLTVVAERSVLIALALMFLAPLVFVVLTSFMTTSQAAGPSIWPQPFHPANFADVFSRAGLLRATGNTLLYAGLRRSASWCRACPSPTPCPACNGGCAARRSSSCWRR